MTTVTLGPKNLSRTRTQWIVDRQQVRSIDRRKCVFLQDKVILFETVMTSINEVNRDKTKVLDFFFGLCFACLF